ncbi:glycine betaine ABC transporter substrate-binding protein [Desulforhopalus singaporensis]|uniref:Glycine betaine/proline transport system substrate-binding protein n=1 Tax=Desulforhopalus singaporensis TaxID=91360 RepID=A0A1H0SHR3_9BACT|nr:glycine betaine ABC transporter substrate-binding protein [Desulforhopalus singaporensis]SDP41205.1 glycine betaine/proline transport system substrate-binding protein [Desulforhopalus singaporensis]
MNRLKTILLLLIILPLLTGCPDKPTIVFYKGSWESIWIVNAISEFIITKGYGYPVQAFYNSGPVGKEKIASGQIDVIMELWQFNNREWYKNQKERGNIVNLGAIYNSAPQYWIIPKWVAEKYHIDTVYDLKEHWRLFTDAEHPFKGVFYNAIFGWGACKTNIVKLKAYGLYKYFDVITPASTYVLESALIRSQQRNLPVFGYSWTPSPMDAYEWHILKEPAFSKECWDSISDAIDNESVLPSVQGCAYEDAPVDKIVHKSFLNKAPDVAEMLRKIYFDIAVLNELEVWTDKNCKGEWRRTSAYFLKNYEEIWKPWVSPGAFRKIKQHLRELE